MAELIESTLIKVPYESLKRTTRDRKYAIDQLKETLKKVKATSNSPASPQDVIQRLESYMRELQHLKRKLDDASVIEREEAQRCKCRLEHLQSLGKPLRDDYIGWNRQRIDRILIDFMLRRGYLESAAKLVKQSNLDGLTDLHIFAGAQRVLASLERKECEEALDWCRTHAVRLKKAHSPLEFQLRIQEFVELVRRNTMEAAIAHARKYLAPWAAQYPSELQRASALLAFGADTSCTPYAALLSPQRWEFLLELFKAELFRLNALPPVSLLEIHLQAGLSALKTPQSLSDSCGNRDPLHLSTYRELAEQLPYAKHVHSKLICAITGEVMSEHNPPMALPNGYVYSQAGLEAIAAMDGKIVCPSTGATYELSEVRRVFIM